MKPSLLRRTIGLPALDGGLRDPDRQATSIDEGIAIFQFVIVEESSDELISRKGAVAEASADGWSPHCLASPMFGLSSSSELPFIQQGR